MVLSLLKLYSGCQQRCEVVSEFQGIAHAGITACSWRMFCIAQMLRNLFALATQPVARLACFECRYCGI